MSSSRLILEVERLFVKRGGKRVLDLPSLTLAENETLAVIGPNGAGKSSLLLSVAGLLPPASGQLRFKGEEIDLSRDTTAYRRRLTMVFQDPLLFDRSVEENIATGLTIRRIGQQELRRQVDESLERFKITHLGRRSARALSGGEAQRVALARAFAVQPELVLLDEPFNSLDPLARKALCEDLAQNLHLSGVAAIITSHDRDKVQRLADRVLVLEKGRIVQCGTAEELRQQPVNSFTAAFFGG
jgi:tungstate transport system ATP-binding protein